MEANAIFGIEFLTNYQMLYIFEDKVAYAATAPYLGRNALDTVELMDADANHLRERVILDAHIHYAITNSGGFSPNVAQSSASVPHLIQVPKTPQVEEVYQGINRAVRGASMMTETDVQIDFIEACAEVVPDRFLSNILYENLKRQKLSEYIPKELGFAQEITKTAPPSEDRAPASLSRFKSLLSDEEIQRCVRQLRGKNLRDIILPSHGKSRSSRLTMSSDVGDVSWNVPAAQIVTAYHTLGTPEHPWQLVSQDKTSIRHKGMLLATRTFSRAAADLLEEPELVEKTQQEFINRLGGQTYHCAIPNDVAPEPTRLLV